MLILRLVNEERDKRDGIKGKMLANRGYAAMS